MDLSSVFISIGPKNTSMILNITGSTFFLNSYLLGESQTTSWLSDMELHWVHHV